MKDDKAELYQQITDVCFEEGCVTKPMVDRIIKLFNQHTEKRVAEARLDEVNKVNAIPSEVGKLANHSLAVSVYLQDRLEQLNTDKKEG